MSKAVYFFVITNETSYCPVCKELLTMRGIRQRVLFNSEEEKQILIIRRLYCQKCGRIHHELPDCIVPYKRYCAEVIKPIVSGQITDAPCPASTARRIQAWWAVVKPYFLRVLQSLVEKFGVSFGRPPAFGEIVRAAANSNNWIFARQLCTRSASRPG
jgi:hypothetical protein